jgi:hypothetical protein
MEAGCMKTLIVLVGYTIASGLIGLIACGFAAYKKRKIAALVCAVIFFGGPVAAYAVLHFQATQQQDEFDAARKEVQELCARNGGDKIYKTVDNVEGVFQMKARNPDVEKQLRDQYGWGMAMGDKDDPAIPAAHDGKSYWFIEQQPTNEKPDGSLFRRKLFVDTGRTWGQVVPDATDEAKNRHIWKYIAIDIRELRSRYGYFIEDISTPETREHWIAGGRIKIIDLQTKEVLAERTGYFLAEGSRWSWAAAQQNGRMCPERGSIEDFLLTVLKPIQALPTNQQLDTLKGK